MANKVNGQGARLAGRIDPQIACTGISPYQLTSSHGADRATPRCRCLEGHVIMQASCLPASLSVVNGVPGFQASRHYCVLQNKDHSSHTAARSASRRNSCGGVFVNCLRRCHTLQLTRCCKVMVMAQFQARASTAYRLSAPSTFERETLPNLGTRARWKTETIAISLDEEGLA